jgi:hypothetical protein
MRTVHSNLIWFECLAAERASALNAPCESGLLPNRWNHAS